MIQAKILKNNFGRIALTLRDGADGVARETAEAIADRWQATTKVDTGEHRDSIHVEKHGDSYAVVAGSDHSLYVELGSRYQRGDHAGTNAAAEQRDPFLGRVRRLIQP